MDQLRWKMGGIDSILPNIIGKHQPKREPGRQRRPGGKKRRLVARNETGIIGAGKHSRRPPGCSTHTPKTMNAKQRRIHKRMLKSEAAMRERKAAT